jgi:hypothetical protein
MAVARSFSFLLIGIAPLLPSHVLIIGPAKLINQLFVYDNLARDGSFSFASDLRTSRAVLSEAQPKETRSRTPMLRPSQLEDALRGDARAFASLYQSVANLGA